VLDALGIDIVTTYLTHSLRLQTVLKLFHILFSFDHQRTRYNTMTNSFFVLPPELRLKIYGHLVTASMADGNIAGICGLLFSCRDTYDELTMDFVPKVHPLLEAMHKWRAAHPVGAPLCVKFPSDYEFIAPPSEITITLPISPSWKVGSQTFSHPFELTIRTLYLICTQSWSTLTFRLDDSARRPKKGNMRTYNFSFYEWILQIMLDDWGNKLENRPFTRTGKLVMSAVKMNKYPRVASGFIA
jgi:hypothetical protein